MLQEILNEMVWTLQDRQGGVVYDGWGTSVDRLVMDYFDLGGEWQTVRHLEDLAYYLA